jgi:lysophospholipase L1-like esterase
MGPGGLLKEGFEGRVSDGHGGTVWWKNDAQGFRRAADVADRAAPGVVRVLSLGDSFVAGYRIDQEATFSRLLEKDLAARGLPAEVLVAEIEEPVNGLFWLQGASARFRPDVVLLGLTLGNDIAQAGLALDEPGPFRIAGAPPRVEPTGSKVTLWERPEVGVRFPDACVQGSPARVPLRRALRLAELVLGSRPQPIASSRGPGLSRFLLDGVNGLGMCLVPPPPDVEVAFSRLERTLLGYRGLAAERGFALAVLLFPQRYAVQPEDWDATVDGYGLVRSCFDVARPARRVAAFCAAQGIACLDPSETLATERRRSGRSLYLPAGDMHFNAAGHRAVFEAARSPVAALVQGKIPSSM